MNSFNNWWYFWPNFMANIWLHIFLQLMNSVLLEWPLTATDSTVLHSRIWLHFKEKKKVWTISASRLFLLDRKLSKTWRRVCRDHILHTDENPYPAVVKEYSETSLYSPLVLVSWPGGSASSLFQEAIIITKMTQITESRQRVGDTAHRVSNNGAGNNRLDMEVT